MLKPQTATRVMPGAQRGGRRGPAGLPRQAVRCPSPPVGQKKKKKDLGGWGADVSTPQVRTVFYIDRKFLLRPLAGNEGTPRRPREAAGQEGRSLRPRVREPRAEGRPAAQRRRRGPRLHCRPHIQTREPENLPGNGGALASGVDGQPAVYVTRSSPETRGAGGAGRLPSSPAATVLLLFLAPKLSVAFCTCTAGTAFVLEIVVETLLPAFWVLFQPGERRLPSLQTCVQGCRARPSPSEPHRGATPLSISARVAPRGGAEALAQGLGTGDPAWVDTPFLLRGVGGGGNFCFRRLLKGVK